MDQITTEISWKSVQSRSLVKLQRGKSFISGLVHFSFVVEDIWYIWLLCQRAFPSKKARHNGLFWSKQVSVWFRYHWERMLASVAPLKHWYSKNALNIWLQSGNHLWRPAILNLDFSIIIPLLALAYCYTHNLSTNSLRGTFRGRYDTIYLQLHL